MVVGPEIPLVAGLADDLEAAGIPTWGPSAKAAQLEGSKAFMKVRWSTSTRPMMPGPLQLKIPPWPLYSQDILKKYSIPTAAYEKFTDPQRAKDFIRSLGAPIVVKASGLAAGKGVVVARTVEEAYKAVDDMLVSKVFGNAGGRKGGEERWMGVGGGAEKVESRMDEVDR